MQQAPVATSPFIADLAAELAAEVVETHASWVLLAGERAWKIKKPIVLPFLDYGTREKRAAACADELRLNRRLAPQLYLDVVGLHGEPAVLMRRFAEAGRADHACARGDLGTTHLADFARRLCEFQRGAAVAAADSPFGSPAQILSPALENFDELRGLLPAADLPLVEQLAGWTLAEHARIARHLQERKARGFVREGHGDLHLGNLVLLDGVLTPFDGIEFNEAFRWIDVASEIAFTWIDLLDHRRPDLAGWLLNAWREASGDAGAFGVLRFHAAYRAVVRAKVAAIRAGQETDGGSRDADLALARDYLALAQRLAVPPAPTLAITVGLSGSGKTTASARTILADPRGETLRLRSDVERKRLFGLAPLAASGSAIAGGIYGDEANRRTYATLGEQAAQLLGDGWSVVVDAAFLRRTERAAFRALAGEHGVPFRILCCEAPMSELRARLAARQGDASEATVAVLERQVGWFEPLTAEEQGDVLALA